MLADIFEYWHSWHWYIVLAFVVVWLLGGTWLFNRPLRKLATVSGKRYKPHKGLYAAALTVLSGVVFAALTAYLFHRLSVKLEMPSIAFAGLGVGLIVGVILSILMSYVVLNLPAGQSFRLSWLPIVLIFGFGAALVAATAPLAASQTETKKVRDKCDNNMIVLTHVLGSMPESLDFLVKTKKIPETYITCPATNRKYLYLPTKRRKDMENALVVCEQAGNHPGGRHVVVVDKDGMLLAKWANEEDFQSWLKLPANKAFDKMWAQSEAK